ncbi:MAG: stage II sporulation protein M [Alphaproteobacteria bacterium]|nr:stage II sporulation protein M [Alphaproteobacteria bacterium]
MALTELKSYRFRREREQTWRELERLVQAVESDGVTSLSAENLLRLPSLYRATLSSLSVARGISLDRNVLRYLESLSMRAYFCVYGARASLFQSVGGFFLRGFPNAVRAAGWPVLIAALCMCFGTLVGYAATSANADWFYTFVPEGVAGGRSPTSSTQDLREVLYGQGRGATESLAAFASFLFTHNAKVGMLCFALGFALGVPTILLLIHTGLILGAFVALYDGRGLMVEFLAWVSIHGTTELLAVILCGGGGLVLAGSIVFPGRASRLDTLAASGRRASRIVIGAVAMFFVAGLLEGFGRQLILDPQIRFAIAASALACWLVYLVYSGREVRDGDG